MQNVTPNPAPPPATPPAVVARRPSRLLVIGPAAVLALVLLIGYSLFPHRNPYEAKADAIVRAIGNNDMTPVIGDFNAVDRPQLEDRVRVARLSNLVVAHGDLKGTKEITPAGSPAGYHEFTETFSNGTLIEQYELDSDGKITKFHIGTTASP